ncbi:MAG: CBS domain-containing protein [Oceanospirillaceae bacterium]|jgi:magnesium and cobalt transporter|nr:CBS domain-containing protein [Oceanospirillaceae bacterium]MBT4998399.1 CBS domain-containing protein [Oceanospirillaceae bacterium]MBT5629487.1 CBS domain-containing protein [Oceanospirillaceae bacterium]MBT6101403.1 CBS domain-containing protein [Oceanospirillaceae bacterium]MBT7673422.1 CBS domain-containing protein [Oceanospirillaceae bacterium]
MNDDASTNSQDKRSWLDKLSFFLSDRPSNKEELLERIRQAEEDQILDREALDTIEGALQMSHMQVRDIMVPRPQMAVVKADQSTQEFMLTITETSHSRFPVIGESPDEVLGILLAKDLLPLAFAKQMDNFDLNAMLRKPIFVPESKRLSILLNEFRTNRYHMAIVLDEYGGVAGLVTIEDVLEQIVGEIEDETDAEEDDGNIRPFADQGFLVKALTTIDDFNAHFGTYYDENEFDTIGGIITQQFGHLPAKDESIQVGDLNFHILAADNRRILLMQVNPISTDADEPIPEN